MTVPGEHRFARGDRVRVKAENATGNPRTPPYARGKIGRVTDLHGRIPNPLDHRDVYPPLCTVAFSVGDVFGGPSRDSLHVDLHEDWLEPAPPA